MKRDCGNCHHYAVVTNICNADREMNLRSECEDYSPNYTDILVVAKTWDAARAKLARIQQKLMSSTNIKCQTSTSIVTTGGERYLVCCGIENLRGRKAKYVMVDKDMSFREVIDEIARIVEYDFTRIQAI